MTQDQPECQKHFWTEIESGKNIRFVKRDIIQLQNFLTYIISPSWHVVLPYLIKGANFYLTYIKGHMICIFEITWYSIVSGRNIDCWIGNHWSPCGPVRVEIPVSFPFCLTFIENFWTFFRNIKTSRERHVIPENFGLINSADRPPCRFVYGAKRTLPKVNVRIWTRSWKIQKFTVNFSKSISWLKIEKFTMYFLQFKK